MKVTRYEVDPGSTVANCNALRQGVEGIHCVLVGSVVHAASDDAAPFLERDESIRVIEAYANGAVNMKVVRGAGPHFNAYILIRPEAGDEPTREDYLASQLKFAVDNADKFTEHDPGGVKDAWINRSREVLKMGGQ